MPIVPPRGDELYREEMPVTLIKFLLGFEVLIGVCFLVVALLQTIDENFILNAPPTFFWLLMAAVFLGSGWLIANFITYRLTIEPESLNLAFGRFKTAVRHEDIESFERDSQVRPGLRRLGLPRHLDQRRLGQGLYPGR